MGGLIKHRKKYVSHKKRWDKETIVSEADVVKDYALKNKKEVRKVEFQLGKFKKIAKELNTTDETKNSAEARNFIEKLKNMGFLKPEMNTLDEVLDLRIRDLLERRLSNIAYRNQLARTPKQARQFVVHGHVMIGGKAVTSPSYIVPVAEEGIVTFSAKSALFDENHPERNIEMGMKEEEKKMEEIPLVEESGPNFDEKEAQMDDEEADNGGEE